MTEQSSPGARFRAALEAECPLQLVGTVNAYSALLAEQTGFRALYLSGAGVANAAYGLPDLGLTGLGDVLVDVRRITAATDVPLLVDIDTGWGNYLMVQRTVREMEGARAAGVHLEDQVQAKRCGHRSGKRLVPVGVMEGRIKAALDARRSGSFVVMARTDACAVEGLDAAVDRAVRYVEAGADMIFAEALEELAAYRRFTQAVGVPVLANMTEFGRTPLFSLQQLREAGVGLVLYPLSAFRAMSAAALRVFEVIRRDGNQQAVLDLMQTREELYRVLGYHDQERRLDEAEEE